MGVMKRFLAYFLLLALATSYSCRKVEEGGTTSEPQTPPVEPTPDPTPYPGVTPAPTPKWTVHPVLKAWGYC